MLYLVSNDFDEQVRLVRAESVAEAIAKAKASVTPEQIAAIRADTVQRWMKLKKTWEDLAKTTPNLQAKADEINPAEFEGVTPDDYNWEVEQEIDPNADVTILEGLYF